MKPVKIFLTFLLILILIAMMAYVFPKKGIEVLPGITLNFPSWNQLLFQDTEKYKDISRIVRKNVPIDTIAPVIQKNHTGQLVEEDTLPIQDTSKKISRQNLYKGGRKPQSPPNNNLTYPDNNPEVLYPFFSSLEKLPHNNQLIRILHYGDSQIEGDRISSYLRDQLQKKFGGAGIGLFPIVLPHNTNIALNHAISKSWERFTILDTKEANFRHKRFGALLSFSRFSPYYSYYKEEVYEAWINLKSSPLAFNRTSAFTICKILYGYNEKPFIVKMNYKDKTAEADMVTPSDALQTLKWDIPQSVEQFTLGFQGTHSPNIYGLALDAEQGIALDNIPLRGSSGTEFTKSDTTFLRAMLDKINVKLIIMHFGVNVVPVIRDKYDYYQKQFYQQLRFFKSIDRDMSVIVMGVSDMSRKVGGDYQSYPNIPRIRDAQKKAAFSAGCAFWDTYSAMGGNNSMPSWVFADPPLARKDFTHFTYKGSVVIAKMFYKALLKEYQEFKKHAEQKQKLTEKDKEE